MSFFGFKEFWKGWLVMCFELGSDKIKRKIEDDWNICMW